ncbi:low-density lipoprotein receptor-like isoform X3 [Mizuhopecten yessoensis]|uniref:low-density lipoprotein receptor-like isoform X3 n=1 Tax=Mizuhopecten yessoensis TaxID=6573 RepID=UPI000B45BFD7|nr:low-density lipoprotein receptor-like isoform X3 [Mizuhopecten yessoensis]
MLHPRVINITYTSIYIHCRPVNMAVGTYLLTAVFFSYFIAISYTQPVDSSKACKPGMVLCANTTKCIPRKWVCDGDADCPNKTDEVNCEPTTCGPGLTLCANSSQCISSVWVCDGDRDCISGSDEANCDHHNKTCSPKEFLCKSSQKCIPSKWQCDGGMDCSDNSDEINCSSITCSPTQFMCKTSQKCINMRWRCDGDDDCGDNSDEENCTNKTCSDQEFMCKSNSMCIHKTWRCDGAMDCVDHSDEQNCTTKATCSADQFECDKKTCIDGAKECDGIKDCFNGRDEAECLPGDVRVLLADRHSLKLVTLSSDTRKALSHRMSPSRTTYNMVGVDYDYGEGYVFWTDVGQIGIYSARFLNSSSTITDERTVVSRNIRTADGLAVDWINNLIYWTDTGRNEISVTDYNGTLRKTLFQFNLDEPRAIVVDPLTGWMYWTDWGTPAKIERAGMNGQQRETIVSANLTWPNGLTLDKKDGRLYWIDSKFKMVESSQTDGTDRKVVSKGKVNHGFGITTSEFAIYITSWVDKGITGLTKSDGRVTRFTNEVTDSITQPMGLKLYSNTLQKQKASVCYTNEFECKYLCLPGPAKPPSTEVRYICACPDGSTCDIGSTKSGPGSSTTTPMTTTAATTTTATAATTAATSDPKTTDVTNLSTSGTTTTQKAVTSTIIPTTSQAPGCRSDQVPCDDSSSTCIPLTWKCDGKQDCLDGSDEKTCPTSGACPAGYFECSNGFCIPDKWMCDGEIDCWNESDEVGCSARCQKGQSYCRTQDKCIAQTWVCDGDYDCLGGTDEYNCSMYKKILLRRR